MKARAAMTLGLALLLASTAVYLARTWIQDRAQALAAATGAPRIETVKVVVAAVPLPFGTKLRGEHLRLIDWPARAAPSGFYRSVEAVLGTRRDGARQDGARQDGTRQDGDPRNGAPAVLRPIEKHEPILRSKISGFGGRASLSALIAPGMRATTIRVNDVHGVAGFILPNDRVDVLLTRDSSEPAARRGARTVTDILLQNMKVLAIDQDANGDRDKPIVARAVTLEVTPVQAQKLTLAQTLGTLSLALRHAKEADPRAFQTISARDLGDSRVDAALLRPIAEQAVVAKLASGTSSMAIPAPRIPKAKPKNRFSSIRILRGLAPSLYRVTRERPKTSVAVPVAPLGRIPRKPAPPSPLTLPATGDMPGLPAPLEAAAVRRRR